MKIEIDQSGRIEETNRDTVLAYVAFENNNKKFRSIKITAKTKRRLQEQFRKIGRPRDFAVGIFSVLCFLLLRSVLKSEPSVTIDVEYSGKDKLIKNIFFAMCDTKNTTKPIISFSQIGKSSMAHEKAIKIFRKRSDADATIKYDKLYKEVFHIKNGRPVLTYQVTMTSGKSAPLRPNLNK